MKELIVKGKNKKSKIIIGEKVENVLNYIETENIVVITDTNVNYFYSSMFPRAKVIVIDAGEQSKSIETVSLLVNKFIEYEIDRSWFVLGIGGGVVCDITGFVASVYMRGLNFGYVATSLLCQVDASVGGKNGINIKNIKNIIGLFNQPEFVICDIDMLKTLPKREIKCGIAEIIKTTLIQDSTLFKYIGNNVETIQNLEKSVLEELLYNCIAIKIRIVEQDEFDHNVRHKLNFGHTIGHAIETLSKFNHGEAIGVGMIIAAKISVEKGLIDKKDVYKIKQLLEKFKLPTNIDFNNDKIMEQIKLDKKREDDKIHFVLLEKIGRAIIVPMDFDEIVNLVKI